MILQLHMYLGEQFIESVEISLLGYGKNDKVKLDLTERMNELKTKHGALIEKAGVQPAFYIGDIPSAANRFRSLKDRYGGGG
jgi:hypothetical protein